MPRDHDRPTTPPNAMLKPQPGVPPGGPLSLLILQPTPFCNLDCDYCYLPHRSDKRRMPLELIDTIAARVAESGLLGKELTVVWHAGEPLVMSLAFYRRAIQRLSAQLPPDVLVRHAFQTNATLIDDQWCAFFQEPGVSVGVSIDGPAPLHDAHRRNRAGQGTAAAVLTGIRRLQAHGVPFHAICVLTRGSLEFPDELFDFFVEEGIQRIAFNIDELEGENRRSTLDAPDSEALFRRFMSRFLHLASAAGWPLRIREVEQLLASVGATHACNQQVTPFSLVTVDWNGNLSTYSPELIGFSTARYPTFVIGNVRQQSIAEMVDGTIFRQLRSDIEAGVAQCRRDCIYFDYCGGGVPANKVFENGSLASSETQYCRLMRKSLVDVAIASRACFANLPAQRAPQPGPASG
jgi:uncharacterized protein